MQPEPPNPPRIREPEIEFLGRLAARVLFALRCFLFVAGAAGIAVAIYMTADPLLFMSENEPIPSLPHRIANNLVWVCIGLPLMFRTRWLLGAGRRVVIALGLLLWFGPMLLEGDHAYGFLIRCFASFVACAILLILRTLSTLTAEPAAP